MIPKIIHYCWFGRGEKPENILRYISGWHQKMPEYQIIEWNEDNFDINNSIEYVKEAYEAQKYAFVSDYVRLYVLEKYGGIYLDTDIEILKSPEPLFQEAELVTGFEMQKILITAFIACEKSNHIIKEFIALYQELHFKNQRGSYDLTPINNRFTELMRKYGLVLDNTYQILQEKIKIYPYHVFCGIDIENSHQVIGNETYTVHHFQASWKEKSLWHRFKYQILIRVLQKILGYEKYDKLKKFF